MWRDCNHIGQGSFLEISNLNLSKEYSYTIIVAVALVSKLAPQVSYNWIRSSEVQELLNLEGTKK